MSGTPFSNGNNIHVHSMVPEDQKNMTTHIEVWAKRECLWQVPGPLEPHYNPSSGQPHCIHARALPICTCFKNGSTNHLSRRASDVSTDRIKASLRSRFAISTSQEGGLTYGETSANLFAMGTATFAAQTCKVEQRPFRWRTRINTRTVYGRVRINRRGGECYECVDEADRYDGISTMMWALPG